MPTAEINNITINYLLEGPPTGDLLVLINGLADDLETWAAQVPDFLAAGYRVLRYDNRGIGLSSRPPGPYTADLLADDLHSLLRHLDVRAFHLLGVSMGGMIAQAYALKYPNDHGKNNGTNGASDKGSGSKMLSLSLCCTYAQPTQFCSRMFAFWADVATRMSVADVMRDVTLWAFTVPFFRNRENELVEVEKAMHGLHMSLEAYLAQLHVIQKFDVVAALEGLKGEEKGLGNLEGRRVLVLAGQTDILIPVVLSREIAEKIEGSQFLTTKGGHACMWEFPDEFNKTVLKFLDEFREHRT